MRFSTWRRDRLEDLKLRLRDPKPGLGAGAKPRLWVAKPRLGDPKLRLGYPNHRLRHPKPQSNNGPGSAVVPKTKVLPPATVLKHKYAYDVQHSLTV